MWPLSWILLFQNIRDILFQNEKLMQAQEEKVQILLTVCANLLAITEKATCLQAAEVPDLDAAIITWGIHQLIREAKNLH